MAKLLAMNLNFNWEKAGGSQPRWGRDALRRNRVSCVQGSVTVQESARDTERQFFWPEKTGPAEKKGKKCVPKLTQASKTRVNRKEKQRPWDDGTALDSPKSLHGGAKVPKVERHNITEKTLVGA